MKYDKVTYGNIIFDADGIPSPMFAYTSEEYTPVYQVTDYLDHTWETSYDQNFVIKTYEILPGTDVMEAYDTYEDPRTAAWKEVDSEEYFIQAAYHEDE